MIDIHCHILPNIDDGPTMVSESIEMARVAVEEGITKIIATPHHLSNKFVNPKSKILSSVAELNEQLIQENIPLTIIPGQETRIYGEMINGIQQDEILTLADGAKYLFVELPSNDVPRYTEQLFYDIQLTGITPIIVHPERNSEFLEEPDMLYKLVKNGALTQITASSITGDFGKKIKKFSEQLITHSLTHFIATDAHNLDRRPFRLQAAYAEVEQKFGTDVFYQLKERLR